MNRRVKLSCQTTIETIDIEKILPDEMVTVLHHAQFINKVQRHGPIKVLFSPDSEQLIGQTFGSEDFDKIKAKSESLAKKLQSECHKIQREFLREIYVDVNVEIKPHLKWADQTYMYGVPPLEVLLQYCRALENKR